MNTVSIIGRMTKSPQLKHLLEGRTQTSFVVAVNKSYKSDEADFVLCTIWGKLAETTVKYCGKGSLVGITGRLNTRSYEKAEGERVFVTEIVVEDIRFLATKKRDEELSVQQTNKNNESDFEFPVTPPNQLPV
ncbi:single-stranded DNA-binding protein [Psychrobacillus psychrodurans]|uniref:single-stranded DNA-binding protein n=1 Tax=Psychrobacillus TaxID=1221880 RepID=UPI001F4E5B66|nr:single-stranded DNA-binding protein [Psychrobacillus psychrodurans]MCK1995739.1 single-stranded DNA-binding protein [Psychrobacillus psychrodurans]